MWVLIGGITSKTTIDNQEYIRKRVFPITNMIKKINFSAKVYYVGTRGELQFLKFQFAMPNITVNLLNAMPQKDDSDKMIIVSKELENFTTE